MCTCDKIFREPVNTITHIAGALGSIVALTLMVVFASIRADAWYIVSFAVFGTTLMLMYTASSLYHGLRISKKTLNLFRRIDHIMIFMVIAGSYTPICLVPLRGPWGWSLFGTVWGLALAGVLIKLFFMNLPRWVSTLIYLIMGWLCVIAVYPIVKSLCPLELFWLAMGGVFYSGGAVVYVLKKPNLFSGLIGFHEIWHVFVLAGSTCHVLLMFACLSGLD